MAAQRWLIDECLIVVHLMLDLVIMRISIARLRVLELAIVLIKRCSVVIMLGVVWNGRCAVLPGGAARDIDIDLISCLAQSIEERLLEDLRAMGGILGLLNSTRLHVLLLVLQLLHLVAIILLNESFDCV